jgi:hypothetical protein
MRLKEIDLYHRKQIYGAKVNLSRAKYRSEKEHWSRKLRALCKSAKQLKSVLKKGDTNA